MLRKYSQQILHDSDGSLISMNLNGTEYYYVLDLQGNVVALENTSGIIVVSYLYDSWGNIISTTDTLGVNLANINPFRYRSYYYDSETNLYYLDSRYYNPELGRFISADSQLNDGLLGNNMYIYCENNPVNMLDYLGTDCIANLDNFNPWDAVNKDGGSEEGLLDVDILEEVEGNPDYSVEKNTGNSKATDESTKNKTEDKDSKTEVDGKPHGADSHQRAINDQVQQMIKSGKYSKITMNISLNKAGLVGSQRPDIIGIMNDGTAEYYEFASKTQAYGTRGLQNLLEKMDIIDNNNDGIIRHYIPFGGY